MRSFFSARALALSMTVVLTALTAFADDPAVPAPGSCQADASGNVSEQVALNSGGHAGGGYWATGVTCFKSPIQKVWLGTRTDAVMAWGDTRPHGSGNQNQAASNPVYSISKGYEAGPSIFAVSWMMRFDHLLMQGTLNQPQQVIVNFGKTSGTNHIRIWRGKIFLGAVNATTTAVTMEAVVDADQTSQGDTQNVVSEYISRLRQQAPATALQ
jgi:hypothetical protein